MKKYDVIIVGAGASGIFAAYEMCKNNNKLNILMIEKGHDLKKKMSYRWQNIKSCIQCNVCNIMNGYGGAGTLSDGKYNITNNLVEIYINMLVEKKH